MKACADGAPHIIGSCQPLHPPRSAQFASAPFARQFRASLHARIFESQARALIAVPEGALAAVYAAAEAEGVPLARLGTTGGDMLAVLGSDLLADGSGAWVEDLDTLRARSEWAQRF